MKERDLSFIELAKITRILKSIKGLKKPIFVVGGIVTEGYSLRDIDIVVSNLEDLKQVKKCLGKLAKKAHFILENTEPPAPIFVKITGKEPRSAKVYKSVREIPVYGYAFPISK